MTNATFRVVRSSRNGDKGQRRIGSMRIPRGGLRRRPDEENDAPVQVRVSPGSRIFVRTVDRPAGLDITQALTTAIAHELWKAGGQNEVLNWLEAEQIVAQLISHCESAQGETPATAEDRDAASARLAEPASSKRSGGE